MTPDPSSGTVTVRFSPKERHQAVPQPYFAGRPEVTSATSAGATR